MASERNKKALIYLEQTQNILDFARLNSEMTLYLNRPLNKKILDLIETNPFLCNIRTASKRTAIIETFKIISSSQNDIHSFFNLFKKIGQQDKQEELNLQLEKYNSVIETVRLLRNKVYGHKDTTYKLEIEYNFLEVLNLIIYLQSIFAKIVESLNLIVIPNFRIENTDCLNGKIFLESVIESRLNNNYL
jgi:hypothetical protein